MNKQTFQKVLAEVCERMNVLTATKGEEYAGRGDDKDQLANFKLGAHETGVEATTVWLVFFNKHMSSIKDYVKRVQAGGTHTEVNKSASEHINGRIDDAILYLVLLRALVQEAQEKEAQEK